MTSLILQESHPCCCSNTIINEVLFAPPKFLFCYIYIVPLKKPHHLQKTIRLCKYKQGQNKCYSWWAFERKKDGKENKCSERFNELKLFNLSKRRSEDLKVPTQETKFQ